MGTARTASRARRCGQGSAAMPAAAATRRCVSGDYVTPHLWVFPGLRPRLLLGSVDGHAVPGPAGQFGGAGRRRTELSRFRQKVATSWRSCLDHPMEGKPQGYRLYVVRDADSVVYVGQAKNPF